MKNATPRRRLRFLATGVAALLLGITGAQSTYASPVLPGCPAAEIFATDNTAIITDPDDPRLMTRLRHFDHEVRRIIRAHGARPGESTLLDGVFWSDELQQTTYERSREFDVDRAGPERLRDIAGVIAKQYDQEAVLTFRCLPRTSPETDAVEIEVPGVEASDLRKGLAEDPEAREKLGGGSVTLDGRLVLVAEIEDLPLARTFTIALGADWNEAQVQYGDREFVG
ncbi:MULTISPECIES: hypothetical protein [unclassified Streptomyces]|uniref:hypothetical protein n=1 Tax=unclassified Streptomyces TaxID=2593676 RepID=UPI0006F2E171|nr:MULTISPECIES: hypothetical protein [unclassified Streptomyces]KQX54693.1 hypothetical protein ASD33_32220 [Streptomyces sp. Root1304]KRA93509.1 hypothetical protein ASE09_32005 [Streptomyces sp. Root66D1]